MTPRINICKVCFKDFDTIYENNSICDKCFNKFVTVYKHFKLDDVTGLVIYEYNDFFKSQLYQLKGCGDIELSSIFLERQKSIIKLKYFGYYVITMPSWHEDDEKRQFKHLIEIIKPLNLQVIDCLKKKIKFKQSTLNKKEREKVTNKFEIINGYQITNKKILIFDDVMTTGSSLKAAIYHIKKFKPKKIKILVLARNCRKIKKYVERKITNDEE